MKNILKLKTIVLSLLLMVSCITEEPRSASSTSAKPKPVVLTTAQKIELLNNYVSLLVFGFSLFFSLPTHTLSCVFLYIDDVLQRVLQLKKMQKIA